MTPTQLGIAHGMMLVRETVKGTEVAYQHAPRSPWRWPWPRFVPLTTLCEEYQAAVRRLGAGPRRKR